MLYSIDSGNVLVEMPGIVHGVPNRRVHNCDCI